MYYDYDYEVYYDEVSSTYTMIMKYVCISQYLQCSPAVHALCNFIPFHWTT